ncbi:hypothetical protein REPUB_Repub13aG0083000 [Reevesia pubescens]
MAANDIQGYGQMYVVSEQQKLDWCDMAFDVYSKEVQKVTEEIYANLSVLIRMGRDGLKSPHSNKSSLSLILQDDEMSGLQIKHKEEWILVKPIPGCFMVNIGDSTEILSNGMYKSIEHKVITNEKKPRMSIAAFANPDDELEIGPVKSMVDDCNRPKMYQNIKFIDYIR